MVSILVCVCILAVAGIFIYKEMQSQKAMQISAGNSHNVGSGFRNITYNGEKYEYNNRITTILYAGVDSDGKMEATSQYGDKARADSVNLVVMDEKKKKMSIVSINRDTMTQIRRYSMSGNDQGLYTTHLGYAYTYGDGGDVSCESLCEAVSLLFGEIPINRYIVTNQDSMPYINNLVDGVTVTVPNNDLSDQYPEFYEGNQVTLDDSNIRDFLQHRDIDKEFSNEPATPAFNLAISEADKLKYELTGSVTSTLTVESLKDKDKDNILIMVTDADGKVHYITPDALDPKTGELTVTFTALGSVVILEKAPIVSKNLESDKYENEKVKAAAEQFKSAEEGTAVSDIFAAAGEGTTVKDQNGEDVDISQYKTCGSLVEVAMKLGDEYFTNAECQFEGTVQMDLEQVDYKALLKSAGIDENTSDEDLLNVEEFEAPDYVLAQLNAVSGEASVSTGLKFGFEKVEGSDRPVLVIKGTFNGLGPVALASKAE